MLSLRISLVVREALKEKESYRQLGVLGEKKEKRG